MSIEFKKCEKGHYYKSNLSACNFCKSDAVTVIQDVKPTVQDDKPTELDNENSVGEKKTRLVETDGGESVKNDRTKFVDDPPPVEVPEGGRETFYPPQRRYREQPKLVGWLVSYTIEPTGVDFRIYEGWNVIGRDSDCNITVPDDPTMSRKHATILFRNNYFDIKDESTRGTIVNGNDIRHETPELHDGDIIQMGDTVFKFRIAL
ncbi:MAG: FHA domain-containing protein [Tannerella sp.]|nr:FHA domain-containing protein [Tannerella sp.]